MGRLFIMYMIYVSLKFNKFGKLYLLIQLMTMGLTIYNVQIALEIQSLIDSHQEITPTIVVIPSKVSYLFYFILIIKYFFYLFSRVIISSTVF